MVTEQMSHRIPKDFATDPEMRACTETIYQAIYIEHPHALARQRACSTRSGRSRRQTHRDPARRSPTWRWTSKRGSPDTNPSYYDGRQFTDRPTQPGYRSRQS
jgi:transposase, IS30 family